MAIYTKTGDKGETSLLNPDLSLRRVSKSSSTIDAIGALDELNCLLGVACSFYPSLKATLLAIQEDLFTIGSILAGAQLDFTSKRIIFLEDLIDKREEKLPALKNFILPGGHIGAAYLHLARSVARRAERKIVLLAEKEDISPDVKKYINRLSDVLFMLAREVNNTEKQEEIPWIGSRQK